MPEKKRPYSPFQVSTSNVAEYAVARLDDLLNWGRKVNGLFNFIASFLLNVFFLIYLINHL